MLPHRGRKTGPKRHDAGPGTSPETRLRTLGEGNRAVREVTAEYGSVSHALNLTLKIKNAKETFVSLSRFVLRINRRKNYNVDGVMKEVITDGTLKFRSHFPDVLKTRFSLSAHIQQYPANLFSKIRKNHV